MCILKRFFDAIVMIEKIRLKARSHNQILYRVLIVTIVEIIYSRKLADEACINYL